MKHTNMRNALIAFSALGSLAAVLTACGGGGSNTSPAAPQAVATPGAAASLPPGGISVTNPAAKAKISITITIPTGIARNTVYANRLSADAKTQLLSVRNMMNAKYGSRLADKHLRTMGNTSPSAVIRAAGAAQGLYAAAVEKQTGRMPQFVSGYTNYMEFVLSDTSNNVLDDEEADCSSDTCTINASVPTGTNLVATLYLYDNYDILIAAGSQSGVNIVLGPNPGLTLTFNPVVGFYVVSPSNSNFSFGTPATSNITIQPEDFGYNYNDGGPVGGPSVLLDSNFTP